MKILSVINTTTANKNIDGRADFVRLYLNYQISEIFSDVVHGVAEEDGSFAFFREFAGESLDTAPVGSVEG